ncbi:MAG: hypothetical protein ACXVFL_03040 [Solirubrobacteraceae bacterium]
MRLIAAAALAAAALVLPACGGGGSSKSSSTSTHSKAVAPATDAAPHGGLAMGLSESNPNLFWHGKDVGPLSPWRDKAEALKPTLYRISIDWSALQPDPSKPPNWALPADGCIRGQGPCRPFAGVRDVLRALHSQAQAGNGFAPMVVFYGVPDWAAEPASGCERPGTAARSRAISDRGLQGYVRMVKSLQALAKREQVDIRWWSPWNEPNGTFFISPQRAACSVASKALAPAVYTKLARALKGTLTGDQQLVVGELAGFKGRRKFGAGIKEFFGALPDDVLCSAGVIAQHAYATRAQGAKDPGPVGDLEEALHQRQCAAKKPIWVTESGVGGPHVGDVRAGTDRAIRRDCRALESTFKRWDADPRVDAAFQYTFRDDPAFPVGLVDPGLTHAWPTYDLIRVWGGAARKPADPAPELPQACAG